MEIPEILGFVSKLVHSLVHEPMALATGIPQAEFYRGLPDAHLGGFVFQGNPRLAPAAQYPTQILSCHKALGPNSLAVA